MSQTSTTELSEPAKPAEPIDPRGFLVPWTLDALGRAFTWLVVSVIVAYLVLCFVNGFAWAAELSPTYGLLVIRLAVAAVLGVVSLFTLPFHAGGLLLQSALDIGLLVLPMVFVARLARTASAYSRKSIRPDEVEHLQTGWLFGIANTAFVVIVAVTVICRGTEERLSGHVFDYLASSPDLSSWVLGIWVGMILIGFAHPGVPVSKSEDGDGDGNGNGNGNEQSDDEDRLEEADAIAVAATSGVAGSKDVEREELVGPS